MPRNPGPNGFVTAPRVIGQRQNKHALPWGVYRADGVLLGLYAERKSAERCARIVGAGATARPVGAGEDTNP